MDTQSLVLRNSGLGSVKAQDLKMPYLNSASVFINDCKNVLNKNMRRNNVNFKVNVTNDWHSAATNKGLDNEKGNVEKSLGSGSSRSGLYENLATNQRVSRSTGGVNNSSGVAATSVCTSNTGIYVDLPTQRVSSLSPGPTQRVSSLSPGLTQRVSSSSSGPETFEEKLEEFLSIDLGCNSRNRGQSGVTSSSGSDLKYSSFVDDVLSQSSEISSVSRSHYKSSFVQSLAQSGCASVGMLDEYIGSPSRFTVTSPTMAVYSRDNVRPAAKRDRVSASSNKCKGVSFQKRGSGFDSLGSDWKLSNEDRDLWDWTEKWDNDIKALKQGIQINVQQLYRLKHSIILPLFRCIGNY